MNTHEELKSNPTLIIECFQNEETSLWEVSLNDSLMGSYLTESLASEAADQIYSAFETGYVNGLLLSFEEDGKEKAKQALVDRGIQFKEVLRFTNDN